MVIKKDINKDIFREYDIRGEYPTQIDADTAYTIGLAYGTKIKSLGKTKCVVGHDNRISGKELTDALIEGITSTGINITYIGLVTTPMYYFACLHLGIDTGVMVTASHNPVNDNGFKIALTDYNNACGEAVKELLEVALKGDFAKGDGVIKNIDIKDAYIERILRGIELSKPLKIVVDPANATGSIIVKDIYSRLNLEIIYINEESDGAFPNHHPDPSIEANMEQLKECVLKNDADLGIGLDGDADRLGIIDEKGTFVAADTLMAVIWNDLMSKVENKTALFDVKCSKQLEDEIVRLGGNPFIYRTGNSYLKNKIKEMDLAFGGELSGHLFFRDRWDGFDDGIYASLRLLEILSNTSSPMSKLYENFPKYYSTPEIKVKTTEDKKFKIVDKVKKYCTEKNLDMITVDGIRVTYIDGWALIRASNTGPNLTLRFEATTEERLKEIKEEFENLVNEFNRE